MDPDLTIVILGKAGVGKSASGNTILGRAAFESKLSFKPVTTEKYEQTGQVFGKKICVIDTPGILKSEDRNKQRETKDIKDTEEEIKTLCQNLLQSNRRVMFLVVIRVGRFTKEDQEAVEAAIRVLGDRGLKKSYLLFTGGDNLKNMKLDDFIFEENEGFLPDVVMKFRAYHLFNNEDKDAEQVRTLLEKAGYLIPAVQREPVHQVKRRIVLIGRSGEGKSSAGNTILGSERFKTGCDFDSVSTKTVAESAEVAGHRVTVVDTPGFTDEALTPEELYLQIMRSLVEASPGPHALVVVVRISRISAADKKLFELLPTLFGSDASKYSMVLFTHGDELRGRSMDDLIRSNRCVSELVSMCGGRFCVFDNTKRGNRRQVREFLRRVDDMVEANGGGHCTSDMFRMVQTFFREERNRLHQSEEINLSHQFEEINLSHQTDERTLLLERDPVNSEARDKAWERIKCFLLQHPMKSVFIAVVALVVGVGTGVGLALGAGVGVLASTAAGAAAGIAAGGVAYQCVKKEKTS